MPTPAIEDHAATHASLVRLMSLSVAAAVATIALKVTAAAVTGSVGFLSDALESVVNLIAALVGLWAVRLAARPPDLGHHFGHGKAEYLSAAVEGGLIFVAATAIVWTSLVRLLDPVSLDQPGLGLVLSMVASVVNLLVGLLLVRAGRRLRSITVEADGRHLLTDVVTSVGVIVGIALVAVFDWYDPRPDRGPAGRREHPVHRLRPGGALRDRPARRRPPRQPDGAGRGGARRPAATRTDRLPCAALTRVRAPTVRVRPSPGARRLDRQARHTTSPTS